MSKLIRTSCAVTVLLCFLFSVSYINYYQFNRPLGTDAMFHLSMSNTQLSKSDIISDLNDIANRNDTYFLLQSSSPNDIEERRDIYYFGDKKFTTDLMEIADNRIYWLFNNLKGNLISSKEITDTPLSGNYNTVHNPEIQSSLMQWAQLSGVTINYYRPDSSVNFWISQIVGNGSMLGIITGVLLVISLSLSWIVQRSRMRCIQMLNGRSVAWIHFETIKNMVKYVGSGAIIGIAGSLVYLYFTTNIRNIFLVTKVSIIPLSIFLIVVLSSSAVLSILFKPNRELISNRTFSFKKYYHSNSLICGVAIILSILTLAPSIRLIGNSYRSYKQSKELQVFQNAVSVSFNSSDIVESEEGLEELNSILKKQPMDSVMLNLDLGSVIDLRSKNLGEYENIIMVNSNFIEKLGFEKTALQPISFKNLTTDLSNFLEKQLKVMLKKNRDIESCTSLYSYKGKGIMALGQNSFFGGKISYPNSALIIIVDNPIENFNIKGFVFPVISTGNLFFMDSNSIKTDLESSKIYGGILSIDSVTSSAATSGQSFALNGIQFLIATAIVLFMLFFAARQKVNVWAKTNRKRNYILTINGKGFDKLFNRILHKNFMISIILVIIGSVMTLTISRYSNLKNIAMAAIVTELIYAVTLLISYKINVRKEFKKTALREG